MKKLLVLLMLAASVKAAPVMTFEEKADEIRVMADGKFMCGFVFANVAKPMVYPLIAPDGTRLNREFPMSEVAGEPQDHPHHTSLWYAHQDANGVDTWNFKKGKIVVQGKPTVKLEDGAVVLRESALWNSAEGKTVAKEAAVYRFGSLADGSRFIDVAVTLSPADGPLKLGDAKDGVLAVRLRPEFDFKNEKTTALNSAGDEKKTIWSKRGNWVKYETVVDGKECGVAMFDDPKNPMSPPRWHARDYGLLSVNPFGEKSFDKTSTKAGGMTIEEGKSASFRYRVLLYNGRKNAEAVENLWREFTETK